MLFNHGCFEYRSVADAMYPKGKLVGDIISNSEEKQSAFKRLSSLYSNYKNFVKHIYSMTVNRYSWKRLLVKIPSTYLFEKFP